MSKAVIYTKTTCPFCVKAKELLKSHSVEMEEHVFGSPKAVDKDMISKAVGRQINTVPQIILNGQYIGGYTDLVEHYKKVTG